MTYSNDILYSIGHLYGMYKQQYNIVESVIVPQITLGLFANAFH